MSESAMNESTRNESAYENNGILSGVRLKALAKAALKGKYGQIILAGLTVGAITAACQFVLLFGESLFSGVGILFYEMLANGVSLAQLEQMAADGSLIAPYQDLLSAIDYGLQILLNLFTAVFQIGMSLFCLNLACGRSPRIADVFYGFRSGLGKSLQLTAVVLLVDQLCSLPFNLLVYLLQHNASSQLIFSAALLLIVCVAAYIPVSLGLSQIFLLTLDFPGYSAGEIIKLSKRIMSGHKSRLFCIQLSFLPLILLSFLSLGIGNLWLTPYMNVTYTFFFLNLMQARSRNAAA